MLMTYGNSKLNCVSVIFSIEIIELGISHHIRPSLCHCCASLQPVVQTPVIVVGDDMGSMTSDCSVQVQLECLSDDKCEELRQLRAEVRMLRLKCQRTSGL